MSAITETQDRWEDVAYRPLVVCSLAFVALGSAHQTLVNLELIRAVSLPFEVSIVGLFTKLGAFAAFGAVLCALARKPADDRHGPDLGARVGQTAEPSIEALSMLDRRRLVAANDPAAHIHFDALAEMIAVALPDLRAEVAGRASEARRGRPAYATGYAPAANDNGRPTVAVRARMVHADAGGDVRQAS